MSRLSVHLLVIDPQVDFMDSEGSTLSVPGGNDDMRRVANLVRRVGKRLDDIHVTLDSHRILDIAHPGLWKNKNGQQPAPFTVITADDIAAGVWQPRNAHRKPSVLGGRTLGEHALYYAQELEKGGKYPLLIWPPHCLIGSSGYDVQEDLIDALIGWERDQFAAVNYVTKGTSPYTEHYGGLQAEVPLPADPATGLNTSFLEMLAQADIVGVAGEALSHCVKSTVDQIAENIGGDQISKFHILTDCSSPVPQVGDGPDFPAIAEGWLKEMEQRGMTLTTTKEFLS